MKHTTTEWVEGMIYRVVALLRSGRVMATDTYHKRSTAEREAEQRILQTGTEHRVHAVIR